LPVAAIPAVAADIRELFRFYAIADVVRSRNHAYSAPGRKLAAASIRHTRLDRYENLRHVFAGKEQTASDAQCKIVAGDTISPSWAQCRFRGNPDYRRPAQPQLTSVRVDVDPSRPVSDIRHRAMALQAVNRCCRGVGHTPTGFAERRDAWTTSAFIEEQKRV
jgi:hypothetical protein